MKKAMRISFTIIISLGIMLGIGCATRGQWMSTPAIQSSGNPYFDVKLEPLSSGHAFFVSFNLIVRNKTDKKIEIDWNTSRYFRKDYSYGGFVFKGMKPEDIINSTIPPDIIPAMGTLYKRISPYKLLTRTPIVGRGGALDESGISPGVLPEGKNGVLLVVTQDGKAVIERISVEIKKH